LSPHKIMQHENRFHMLCLESSTWRGIVLWRCDNLLLVVRQFVCLRRHFLFSCRRAVRQFHWDRFFLSLSYNLSVVGEPSPLWLCAGCRCNLNIGTSREQIRELDPWRTCFDRGRKALKGEEQSKIRGFEWQHA